MKAVNIDEKGWIYGRWEVMENTWEIQDRHGVGAYLLFLSELDWKDTVAKHLENMEKLAAHGDKIKSIWPAHNGSPLTPRYLYDYIELDKRILAGTAEEQPDLAGYNMGPDSSGLESFFKCRVVRYRYGEASIVVKQQ